MECDVDDKMQRWDSKVFASLCGKRKSAGRNTLEKEKSVSENIQSRVRSNFGQKDERRNLTGYKCTDPGIFGQEEGGEVFECTKRLWKTVVRSADGGPSDDRIYASDQLLDEKISDPDSIVNKWVLQ